MKLVTYMYECKVCGDITHCSEDKEPEECFGCGAHHPEQFMFYDYEEDEY